MLTPTKQREFDMLNGTRLAAVDLGSNSFRLEIGRIDHGQFNRTEYLKETVRQGNGLDEDRNLTPEAMQRGWDCLARFGERLAGFGPSEVRAVATQTLREARNSHDFIPRANEALGFPIDVISGQEEARLIYQGVAHALPQNDERRLVIDIGGRSTELILGQGYTPTLMESYRVGSIAWSTRYFPNNQYSKHAFDMAEIAAKAILDDALNAYRRSAWDVAYGSAGTVGAVGDVLAAAGWPTGAVSRDGLDWLLDKLILAQSADRIRLAGMKDDRRAIIAGGLSILRALFDLLQIDHMQQASGGLRHGLLHDLMGSDKNQLDVRSHSVKRLVSKFGADEKQGLRVSQVAMTLIKGLGTDDAPDSADTAAASARKVSWAAQLYEIGCQISHTDAHKHGAYILDHADAIGFSIDELHQLSLLILGHRGKLRKLNLDLADHEFTEQLLALRLAIALCHARRDPVLNGLTLSRPDPTACCFVLKYPSSWALNFPQSTHLLHEEALAWQKTPWSLQVEAY